MARMIWMGRWDPRRDREPSKKDEQAFREFLRDKYERKKWYRDPSEVKRDLALKSPEAATSVTPTSLPSLPPPTQQVRWVYIISLLFPLSHCLGDPITCTCTVTASTPLNTHYRVVPVLLQLLLSQINSHSNRKPLNLNQLPNRMKSAYLTSLTLLVSSCLWM